jgi:hypothetical protein
MASAFSSSPVTMFGWYSRKSTSAAGACGSNGSVRLSVASAWRASSRSDSRAASPWIARSRLNASHTGIGSLLVGVSCAMLRWGTRVLPGAVSTEPPTRRSPSRVTSAKRSTSITPLPSASSRRRSDS